MAFRIRRALLVLALPAAGFAFAWLLLPRVQGQARTESSLASAVVRAEDAAPTRGPWGHWLRYFRGDTHGTRDMIVLAVTLKPGQAPHPPHQHADEEFMILAEGSGTWTLDGKEMPARKGDVLYAAPWTLHGLKNIGDTPLTYYMVKWSNKRMPAPAKPCEKPPLPQDQEKQNGIGRRALLQERATLNYPGRVYAVAFARDGKSLASGGQGGRVKLWDVTTTKELAEFTQAD